MIPKCVDIGYVRITWDKLEALPPKLSQLIRELLIPTDGKTHITNYGLNVIHLNGCLNHSITPNMRTTAG
jgi:hypothetical protein